MRICQAIQLDLELQRAQGELAEVRTLLQTCDRETKQQRQIDMAHVTTLQRSLEKTEAERDTAYDGFMRSRFRPQGLGFRGLILGFML